MTQFDHSHFLKTLSSEPGVYRMLDSEKKSDLCRQSEKFKKTRNKLLQK